MSGVDQVGLKVFYSATTTTLVVSLFYTIFVFFIYFIISSLITHFHLIFKNLYHFSDKSAKFRFLILVVFGI